MVEIVRHRDPADITARPNIVVAMLAFKWRPK